MGDGVEDNLIAPTGTLVCDTKIGAQLTRRMTMNKKQSVFFVFICKFAPGFAYYINNNQITLSIVLPSYPVHQTSGIAVERFRPEYPLATVRFSARQPEIH